jgi:ATP-binding cassette subfamily F protein uup
MAILVSAHELRKSFATKQLFKQLTFAIEEGDHIGLIGPNGAGKSTLLKIIAGQTEIDSGELSKQRGLKLAFLEQTPTFKEGTNVFDTVCEPFEDPFDSHNLQVINEVLSRLELSEIADRPITTLSGGWKKRVALARELVREPQLLLLDEPTNHLDLESILWLEDFLEQAPFAIMMVTHDRLFLQRTCTRIFDLDPRNANGLLALKGDYAAYVQIKEDLMNAQLRQETVMKNTMRRETEWLRRGAKARQTKQQARIHRAGELKEELGEVSARNVNRTAQIEFAGQNRSPQKLIEAESISKTFNERTLFKDLNVLISPKTRLGLLGNNGSGKSTLIRALIGEETPDSGTIKRAEGLQIAYFDQHRETLKPELSVLRNICSEGDYVSFQNQFVFARSYLDRFLFRPEQIDMPVAKLSGGEQSRLRIAQLMLLPANVLILDEPTNDLDLQTLNVLQDTLLDFKGAVILVTHDRFFLDQVTNDIFAFPGDGSGEINRFADYIQWETWFRSRGGSTAAAEVPAPKAEAAGPKKKLSFKEKFELENMEKTIQAAEAELEKLQVATTAAAVGSQTKTLFVEMEALQKQIDGLYSRWTELESKSKSKSK